MNTLVNSRQNELNQKPSGVQESMSVTMPGKRITFLALLAAAVLLTTGVVHAADTKPAPKPQDLPLEAMLGTPLPEVEKTAYGLITDNVKNQSRENLKGKKLLPVTARLAALQAIEKNLDIQLSVHDEALRRAAMMEAKAAFLPVFNVGIFRDYQSTYSRSRLAMVFKGFIPFRSPVVIPLSPTISGINFVPLRIPGLFLDHQFASKRSKTNGQKRPVRFNVSVSQLLPWGATVNLSTNTVHQITYSARRKSYDAPWTTSLNATLTVPFPFTKDFGPLAPQDVAIKLAKLDAERSYWDLKAAINATLLITDLAYWDLVGAAKNLEVTVGNRQLIEKLVKNTQDALKAGRTTEYGMDQVNNELLRVKELEEQAWNFYVLASDNLTQILDGDRDAVLVPYGYSKHVDEHLGGMKAEDALALALEARPELKAENLGLKATEVQVEFSRHQLLPDLTASSTISLIQTNNEIGYHTLLKSLNNIFTEDARTLTFGLNYRYPLFNRAFHARYHQALAQRDAQKLTLRINENQVTQEVHDGLAAVESAQGRVQASLLRVDAARKAYEMSLLQQEKGRITDFEIVSKFQEKLTADVLQVIAQVDQKRSEAQLLFAQGVLPDLYPRMTAQTEFDKYRLEILRASKAMYFFNGYVKNKGGN